MNDSGTRRAVAEIRFGEDRSAIAKVAGRSIHQYWNVLSPYFRDVLLAPQRRSDDGGVSWTWKEPPGNQALSAAELGSVRKRLEKAARSFADRPASSMHGDDGAGGIKSPELFEQVSVRVKTMIGSLGATSDSDLANLVCRTESGPMVHSWGVASPAPIHYPDSMESEIQGLVLVGGNVSAGHEVVVENVKGLVMMRAHSDERGAFRFPKIRPGRYRVRVLSDRVNFPVKGMIVNVERGAATRVELRSTTHPDDPKNTRPGDAEEDGDAGEASASSGGANEFPSPARRRKGRRGTFVGVGVATLLALLIAGGVWGWRSQRTNEQKKRPVSSYIGRAPDESLVPAGNPTISTPASGGIGAGAPASVDGVGKNRTVNRPPRPEVRVAGAGEIVPRRRAGEALKSPPRKGADHFTFSGGADAGVSPGSADEAPAEMSATAGAANVPSIDAFRDAAPNAAVALRGERTGAEPDVVGKSRSAPVKDEKATGTAARGGEAEPQNSSLVPLVTGPAVRPAVTGGPAKSAGRGGSRAVEGESVVSFDTALPSDLAVNGAVPAVTPRTEGGDARETAVDAAPPRNEPLNTTETARRPSGASAGAGPAVAPPDGAPADSGEPSQPAAGSSKKIAGATARPHRTSHGVENHGANLAGQNADPTAESPPAGSAETGSDAETPVSGLGEPNNAISPQTGHPSGYSSASPPALAELDAGVPSIDVKASVHAPAPRTSAGSPGGRPANPPAPGAAAAGDKISAGDRSHGPDLADPIEPDNSGGVGAAGQPRAAQTSAFAVTAAAAAREQGGEGIAAVQTASSRRRIHKLMTAQWEPRLIRDVIVPTQPVRSDEAEDVEAVRKSLMEERRARLPATFKRPVFHYGLVLEVEALSGVSALRWVNESTTGEVSATIKDGRAELRWRSNDVAPDGMARLLHADGTEAARVTFNPDGSRVVDLGENGRGWFWIGADYSAEDSLPKGPARFSWRLLGSAGAARVWRSDSVWRDARGCRLEVSLDTRPVARATIALVDRISGWALMSEIE